MINKKKARAEVSMLTGKSRQDGEGRCPVTIRVYDPASKKDRHYRTGTSCFPEEFDNVAPLLESTAARANDIVDKIRLNSQVFSFDSFERNFLDKANSGSSIKSYLQDCSLNEPKESIKTTINDLISILTRTGMINFNLGEVDYAWVTRFRNKMRSLKRLSGINKGKTSLTENSVRLHLRTFRKYLYQAQREGHAPIDTKPFEGIDTQSVPSDKVKRYLMEEELDKLWNHTYRPHNTSSRWKESKDLFMFSYLACGLNLKDILDLKWSSIHNGSFVLRRKKTTSHLTLKIGQMLKSILDQQDKKTEYIFEYLRVKGDAKVQEDNHNLILGWIGSNIKYVCKQAGIKDYNQIVFYSARHTFAVHYMDRNKNPNASIFELMQYLGHNKEESTHNYLRSLIGNTEVKDIGFLKYYSK